MELQQMDNYNKNREPDFVQVTHDRDRRLSRVKMSNQYMDKIYGLTFLTQDGRNEVTDFYKLDDERGISTTVDKREFLTTKEQERVKAYLAAKAKELQDARTEEYRKKGTLANIGSLLEGSSTK